MGKNDFEIIENFCQKLFCLFVIDVSSPISEDYITELNRGLEVFHQAILSDGILRQCLEIGIMTYNGSIETLQEPSLAQNFRMPKLSSSYASTTFEAIYLAIDKIGTRIRWYKETGQPFFRPWIVLLSHSKISSGLDFNRLALKINSDTDAKRYHFLPVCFDSSSIEALQLLSGNNKPAIQLSLKDMKSFFQSELPLKLLIVVDPELYDGHTWDVISR